MEKINIANSPKDIQTVNEYVGFVKSQLASMGNNNTEWEEVDKIYEAFESGQLDAEAAIKKLKAVPEAKQVGVF